MGGHDGPRTVKAGESFGIEETNQDKDVNLGSLSMSVMPFKNIVGSATVPTLHYGGHGGPPYSSTGNRER